MADKKKKDDISINLNCYVICFREKNKKDEFVKLDKVFGNKTFKQIIQSFVKNFDTSGYFLNETKDRIFYLDKTLLFNEDTFSGIVRKGYSGHETYVDELKENKVSTLSTITRDKFNTTPFYLLITLPKKNESKIVFFAQSYKQFGFKELFEEAFKKFVKDNYTADIICEIGTLSVANLFEKYIREGNIRKLRFKKHILPKNFENVLGDDDIKDEKLYEVELSIKAKQKGFMGIKKDIKFTDSTFTELFKFDGFDYDEAFADVSIGNRSRALNISKPSSFSASFDVTEKSAINKNTNHPDFEKLHEEATAILKEEILPNFK